ncbi:MAG: hypothetical protein IIZ74_04590, partial [Erysipelotrichaceae bacterium]|nr:hypothetical protein [Erysipelotrichaceae bacterium]
IFRIGRTPEGKFRFFLSTGKILDKPQQFLGTSLVVETDTKAEEIITKSVRDGWEPHYVVVYGDVSSEIEILGDMLNIPVCRY